MAEYIKRIDALKVLEQMETIEDGLDAMHNLPAADVVEVKRGYWEHLGGDEWCCTNCGDVIHTEGSWDKPTYNYCHECGADMRERSDNNAAD